MHAFTGIYKKVCAVRIKTCNNYSFNCISKQLNTCTFSAQVPVYIKYLHVHLHVHNDVIDNNQSFLARKMIKY